MEVKKYYLIYSQKSKSRAFELQKAIERMFDNIKIVNPYTINKTHINNPKLLIKLNADEIKNSDGCIALIDDTSTDAHMKIVYAYLFRKPIYCVMLRSDYDAWIYYHCTKIMDTTIDLIKYFKEKDIKKIIWRPQDGKTLHNKR